MPGAQRILIQRHAEHDDGAQTIHQRQQLRGKRIGVHHDRRVRLRRVRRQERVLPDHFRKLRELAAGHTEHRLHQRSSDERADAFGADDRHRAIHALHRLRVHAIELAVRELQQAADQRRDPSRSWCDSSRREVSVSLTARRSCGNSIGRRGAYFGSRRRGLERTLRRSHDLIVPRRGRGELPREGELVQLVKHLLRGEGGSGAAAQAPARQARVQPARPRTVEVARRVARTASSASG